MRAPALRVPRRLDPGFVMCRRSSSSAATIAACFYAEEDYRFYLHWLQLNAEHYGWRSTRTC